MSNRLRRALLLLPGLLLSVFLHAGGNWDTGGKPLVVHAIKGPSGLGLIRLFEEAPAIAGFSVSAEALANQDLMAARFLSGEAKAGILPPNMAAKIAAAGRDIRAAAVIGQGMLSLLSSDTSIRSIQDLRGKTVPAAGQGATPDYVFQKILSFHGLEPGSDVHLSYSLAPPEIAQSLIAGRIAAALLPEPFASMARMGRPDLTAVADIQEEWRKSGGGENYPMTLLVFDGEFASAYPYAAGEIMNAVKNSVEWVKENPAEAGALAEKHSFGLKAGIAAAAIPGSAYVFIPAEKARPSIEALLKVFLEYDPVSVGGVLPAPKFYMKDETPSP